MGSIAKTVFKILLILLIIGSLMAIYTRAARTDSEKIIFKIFMEDSSQNYFNKLLGILPEEYKSNFKWEILEEFNDAQVINLIDKRSSHIHYFLLFKFHSETSFLKAHPFNLLKSNRNLELKNFLDWENHVSYLIDKDVFNTYIAKRKLTKIDQIIYKYCYFLSNPNSQESFKIINQESDLHDLISQMPLIHVEHLKELGYKILDIEEIKISPNGDEIICWYQDKGIVSFHFLFDQSGNILYVKSNILGVLGNEYISCC